MTAGSNGGTHSDRHSNAQIPAIGGEFGPTWILRTIQTEQLKFSDSLCAFSNQIFTPLVLTLFCKRLILFCWSILLWVGSVISIFTSYCILYIYNQAPNNQLSDQAIQQISHYSPSLFLGLLLVTLGLIISLPQRYAYSQAEFILYGQLKEGTAKIGRASCRERV